jgi:hypothetical protein
VTKERKRPVRGPNLGAYIAQAEAAGKHVASVTVKVTLTFTSEVTTNTAADQKNPWDEVLTNAADQKRPT